MNEEFPVSASHKLALITSLPFVHTARRYYRLDVLVSSSDWSWNGWKHPYRCAEKTSKLERLEAKVLNPYTVEFVYNEVQGTLDLSSL